MADIPQEDVPQAATEQRLTPLEMVRATKKRQRDTLKAGSRTDSLKNAAHDDKQDTSDNPTTANPRLLPQRELG